MILLFFLTWPGTNDPSDYPTIVYGTEAFELNKALSGIAFDYASTAVLNDSDVAIAYRSNYTAYAAASSPPSKKLSTLTTNTNVNRCCCL